MTTEDAIESGQAPGEPSEGGQGRTDRTSCKNHKGRRHMDDDFMMRLYKIKMCTRTTPHNWKLCPWAHPGEAQAIRRDPSYHMAELCPAIRQHQQCPHGEGCLYSRNTFESYLHPYRYRTTMCSAGEACTRNICFFAHCPSELRQPPDISQQWQLQLPQSRALPGATATTQQGQQQQQQQQQLATGSGPRFAEADVPAAAGISGPLPSQSPAATGVLPQSSISSPSEPLPLCTQGTAAGWPACTLLRPGSSMPVAAYQPSQQLQLQLLMQQQQLQAQQQMAVYSSPQAAAPVSSMPHGAASLQQELLLSSSAVQPQRQQLLPTANMYDPAAAAAAKFGAASMQSGVAWASPSAVGTHTMQQLRANLQGASAPNLFPGDSLSLQRQQQQQQQAVVQAELLLQQLQLAGAASRQASAALSTDSLQSMTRQGSSSSSTVPQLSHLTFPGLSTDSLTAVMQPGLALQHQELQSSSGQLPRCTAAAAGAAGVLQEMGLLPDALGLMQLSSLDEGTLMTHVAQAQQQQQGTLTAMQQPPGQFW